MFSFECFDCRVTFRAQFPDDPDGPQYCQACGSERLIPRDELDEALDRDEARQLERHRHQ